MPIDRGEPRQDKRLRKRKLLICFQPESHSLELPLPEVNNERFLNLWDSCNLRAHLRCSSQKIRRYVRVVSPIKRLTCTAGLRRPCIEASDSTCQSSSLQQEEGAVRQRVCGQHEATFVARRTCKPKADAHQQGQCTSNQKGPGQLVLGSPSSVPASLKYCENGPHRRYDNAGENDQREKCGCTQRKGIQIGKRKRNGTHDQATHRIEERHDGSKAIPSLTRQGEGPGKSHKPVAQRKVGTLR